MFDKFVNTLQAMPNTDKWLLGVSAVILINIKIAFVVALGIVGGFTIKYVANLIKEIERG